MFKVNERVNHKVFGEGVVIESVMDSTTNYITVKFTKPTKRDYDSYIHSGVEEVYSRRFTEASIKPFLV